MSTLQTTTSSSSSTSSSSTLSTGNPNTSNSNSTYHYTIYYILIALSILGGIVLLTLLGVIAFRYINRRRSNYHRHQCIKESFWRKWHWDLMYSRVDVDAQVSSSDNSHCQSKEFSSDVMQEDGHGHHHDAQGYEYDGLAAAAAAAVTIRKENLRNGFDIMDWHWWRGRSFSRIEEGLGEEVVKEDKLKKKKKKQKLGTVHKVKRFKPNDAFEIDSDVRMSVDLTLIPSRCSTR